MDEKCLIGQKKCAAKYRNLEIVDLLILPIDHTAKSRFVSNT